MSLGGIGYSRWTIGHGLRLGLKGRDFEPYQCNYGPLSEGRKSCGCEWLIQEWCVLPMRRTVCAPSGQCQRTTMPLVAQELSERT